MQLRILGTRGNIEVSAPGYTKHSGILIDGALLLDIGEKQYLRYRPRWIFITHLHSDHAALRAGDVPENLPIYAPEPSPLGAAVRIVTKPMTVGAYTITPVPTVHSQTVKSVGYIVQKEKQRIFYSSDMVRIAPRFHHLLKNTDLVITDGSFIREGGLIRLQARTGKAMGHNGIPDLIHFFSRFTKCIVITHFGTWFFKDIPASRRKIESYSDGVQVIAAKDGKLLELHQTVV